MACEQERRSDTSQGVVIGRKAAGIGLLPCVIHLKGVDVYLSVLCHGLKFFENRVSKDTNC